MCGICGLVAPSGAPDAGLVGRMNDALVHRGPDEGSIDGFGRCVLGHRRLQVIDLETGSQPVEDEAGDIVCVFNGELYNFRELRAELAGKGHDVRGTGDTPVIPHLYEEYGLDFPQRLSGMFAIALWDRRRDRLVLVRDRVGKKPLLWTVLPDETFAFASELKALARIPELRRRVDPAALDAYLALQYVPGGTGLRNIHKLPPGSTLVWEHGRADERRYDDAFGRVEAAGDEEWLELVRETVRAAVRRRLVADVPLGALLSGGIDSTIVVALMAEASTRPVKTFTVGFSDPRYNERAYARAVAERYGTEHEELTLEVDAAETLPRLASAFDEPLGDEAALPLYLICEAAGQHVTVALTGDGGDEAFGGYERYLAYRLAGLPGARLAPTRLLRFLGKNDPRTSANRLARLGEAAKVSRDARYGGLMEVFPAQLRSELWEPGFVERATSASRLLGQPRSAGIAGLQLLDVKTYLPGDLLLKADIASMAHSLELRSPFLDRDVLRLGISLPDSLKFRGRRGKHGLRLAFSGQLPPEIGTRSKRGFGVPLAGWFRGELRELAADLLLGERARRRGQLRPQAVQRLLDEHVNGRADHGHRLWCLVMLELWQRSYVESEHPPPTAARIEPAVSQA